MEDYSFHAVSCFIFLLSFITFCLSFPPMYRSDKDIGHFLQPIIANPFMYCLCLDELNFYFPSFILSCLSLPPIHVSHQYIERFLQPLTENPIMYCLGGDELFYFILLSLLFCFIISLLSYSFYACECSLQSIADISFHAYVIRRVNVSCSLTLKILYVLLGSG